MDILTTSAPVRHLEDSLSENWLPSAVDVAGVGVWDYNLVTGDVIWSARFRAIFGMGPSTEWNRDDFYNCLHPHDRERVSEAVARASDPAIRAPYDMEYRIVWPDGSIHWVIAKGKTVFAGNQAVRFVGTAVDVTAHRSAEARLAAVVKSAQDGVITATLNGVIVDWNPIATQIYGYTPEEMIGGTLHRTVPAEKQQECVDLLARVNAGETITGVQTERIHKSGKRLHVLLNISPVLDHEAQVVGMTKIVKDITETVASEDRLRQAKRMEAVGVLAGGLAHDFNNLLTVINGYSARLAAQFTDDDPIRDQVLKIGEAGRSAEALTRKLLAFSRQQVLQPRPISLNDTVSSFQHLARTLISPSVRLVTRLSEALPRIMMDEFQLEQVLLNLVTNADESMPGGGVVTIETSAQSLEGSTPSVVLTIRDSGSGIAPEVLPRIFDPFFTTKPLGQATGLGLATVHGIVKQSKGEVRVSSSLGAGTEVKVYFPVCEDSEESASASLVDSLAPRNLTVLLAEDEPLLLEYATDVLEDAGYMVIEAADGPTAVALSRELSHIDLLITDLVMPGMSGRELADAVKLSHPDTEILFMSGYSGNLVSRDGVLEPGVHYLAKPFDPEKLQRAVAEVLAFKNSKFTVLVVDDDCAVRETLVCLLNDAGYATVEASDGATALAASRANSVDIVLLDLVMPDHEGIEALQELKKVNPELPIVVMSGFPEYLLPTRALGAVGVLEKPISADVLSKTIRPLLHRTASRARISAV